MTRPSTCPRSVAAILAFVTLACAACMGDVPSPSAPAAISTASEAISSDAASPEPTTSSSPAPPTGWERVLDARTEGESTVAREVVHGNAGFLAFGDRYVSGEGGPRLTARQMWRSPDGRAWEEVAAPIEVTNEQFLALTTTRDGDYLLISAIIGPDLLTMATRAQRSSDGATWEEVETGLPDNLVVASVDHGPSASLMAANVFTADASDSGAWLSADGITWERVLDVEDPGRFLTVTDSDAGTEGFVVVGTSTVQDSSSHQYFALASADGREWVDTRSPFGPEDPEYRPSPFVAALGGDWLAVLTTTPDESVQFHRSADGIAWETAGLIDRSEPLSIFQPVFDEVAGSLYFSTSSGLHPPIGNAGIWASTDGSEWTDVDLGVPAYLGGVTTGDDVIVIHATEVAGEGTSSGGIWVRSTD
jgi:hypothetical protein